MQCGLVLLSCLFAVQAGIIPGGITNEDVNNSGSDGSCDDTATSHSTVSSEDDHKTTTAAPSSLCGKCSRLTTDGKNPQGKYISSCNQQLKYSTDDNGCEQVTVNCTGYGAAGIHRVTPRGETYQFKYGRGYRELNITTELVTVEMTMHCLKDGWSYNGLYLVQSERKLNCIVAKEVENPLPCAAPETTDSDFTSTLPAPTTAAIDNSTLEPVICGTCLHPTAVFGAIYGLTPTCIQRLQFSKDAYGCDQFTVSCTGYGTVIISIADYVHIAIGGGDKNKVTTLSHTVSCEEGGRWSRGKLYAAHVIKKLACEVSREVDNSPSCPGRITTPSSSTSPLLIASSTPEDFFSPVVMTSIRPTTSTSATSPGQDCEATQTQGHPTTTAAPPSPTMTTNPVPTTEPTSTVSSTRTTFPNKECEATETTGHPTTAEASIVTTPEKTDEPTMSTTTVLFTTTASPYEDCQATEATEKSTTTVGSSSPNTTVNQKPTAAQITSTATTEAPVTDC